MTPEDVEKLRHLEKQIYDILKIPEEQRVDWRMKVYHKGVPEVFKELGIDNE